jgi:hypothetical protein
MITHSKRSILKLSEKDLLKIIRAKRGPNRKKSKTLRAKRSPTIRAKKDFNKKRSRILLSSELFFTSFSIRRRLPLVGKSRYKKE